jgi:hypothetical protein
VVAQHAYTGQTPATEESDPGAQHLYGVQLTISNGGTLKRTGNRWWCPSSSKPTGAGWAVWDNTHGVQLAHVAFDATSLVAGWNDVADLGADVDLTGITSITVYGRWFAGNSVYTTLGPGFPIAGSGADISIVNGTFGFGAITDAPTAGGGGTFNLLGFADVSITFGAPAEVTLTPVTLSLAAVVLGVAPGPVTVALTPTTVTVAAVALAPQAQAVTVALSPAALVLAADDLSPVPQPVTVALTPAVLTLTAVALSTGSRPIVTRPNTGTVTRPFTGTVTRP